MNRLAVILKNLPIIRNMFINGIEFFTVEDIETKTGKTKSAIKQILHSAGIKPISKDAIYSKDALITVENTPSRGWQKGKPRKPKEPEAKPI